MSDSPSTVTRWLSRATPLVFSVYAIVAAFSAYFCMYAFRKPFAVGTFEGEVLLPFLPPLSFKILLVVSQVIGYCISKFAGIKVISELRPAMRAKALVLMISCAWGALILFGLTPRPWSAIWLFANGLPLGMVWGLVFGFLEGRRVSEALGVGLSASYIVASGAVKTVGKLVMQWGVPEHWMPAATGFLFFPGLLLCAWLLAQLPPPTAEDEAARTERRPMDKAARRAFVLEFLPGVLLLTGLYTVATAYRDFRDNFAREIWDSLGYGGQPAILTTAELPIALVVLIALGLLMPIKNNRRALLLIHVLMALGSALIGLSTLLYQLGILGAAPWMMLVGLGLYLAYVPYGCVLFDRLIAAVRLTATAGFMIYVTDAFGYLGSVALLLYKNFGQANLSWLQFFIGFSYATAGICTTCFAASTWYFFRKTRSM